MELTKLIKSLSARRAWIEIVDADNDSLTDDVALRKESVDRNKYVVQCRKIMGVVALRKESVDRNTVEEVPTNEEQTSLSARRAWIEILLKRCLQMRNRRRSPQGERG